MVLMVQGLLNWRNKGRPHLSRLPFQQNNAESLPSMCRPCQFSQSRSTWLYQKLPRWATVMIPTLYTTIIPRFWIKTLYATEPQSHRNQWSQWHQRSHINHTFKVFSTYTSILYSHIIYCKSGMYYLYLVSLCFTSPISVFMQLWGVASLVCVKVPCLGILHARHSWHACCVLAWLVGSNAGVVSGPWVTLSFFFFKTLHGEV